MVCEYKNIFFNYYKIVLMIKKKNNNFKRRVVLIRLYNIFVYQI